MSVQSSSTGSAGGSEHFTPPPIITELSALPDAATQAPASADVYSRPTVAARAPPEVAGCAAAATAAKLRRTHGIPSGPVAPCAAAAAPTPTTRLSARVTVVLDCGDDHGTGSIFMHKLRECDIDQLQTLLCPPLRRSLLGNAPEDAGESAEAFRSVYVTDACTVAYTVQSTTCARDSTLAAVRDPPYACGLLVLHTGSTACDTRAALARAAAVLEHTFAATPVSVYVSVAVVEYRSLAGGAGAGGRSADEHDRIRDALAEAREEWRARGWSTTLARRVFRDDGGAEDARRSMRDVVACVAGLAGGVVMTHKVVCHAGSECAACGCAAGFLPPADKSLRDALIPALLARALPASLAAVAGNPAASVAAYEARVAQRAQMLAALEQLRGSLCELHARATATPRNVRSGFVTPLDDEDFIMVLGDPMNCLPVPEGVAPPDTHPHPHSPPAKPVWDCLRPTPALWALCAAFWRCGRPPPAGSAPPEQPALIKDTHFSVSIVRNNLQSYSDSRTLAITVGPGLSEQGADFTKTL